MKISFSAATEIDKPAIRTLLTLHKLPLDGLFADGSQYFVARDSTMFVGVAGLEYYPPDALLRSVAIAPEYRTQGIGSQLVDFTISTAKEDGLKNIILLTTTAARFFERKGFQGIERTDVHNPAILKSPEFAFACCESAITMKLELV